MEGVFLKRGEYTEALDGERLWDFEPLVKEGDKVARGQKIMTFDRGKIKAAGYPDTVVFLLTNSDDYPDFKTNL